MKSGKIEVILQGEGTSAEINAVRTDPDKHIYGNYVYTCVQRVATDLNCPVHEAEREVKAPRTERHIERAGRFRYALDNVQEFFDFVVAPSDETAKNKQKQEKYKKAKLKFTELKDFFGPMMKVRALKLVDENLALQACKKYQKWLTASPDAEDATKGMAVDEMLDEAMNKWRAFESKGKDQRKWCNAADYTDCWFNTGMTSFSTFFLCDAGPTWDRCNTLILNKDSCTLFEDPNADHQRWYCKLCTARYLPKRGVVCELGLNKGSKNELVLYAFAKFPEQGMQDAKLMMVEQRLKECASPQELYDALPTVKPLGTSQFLREVPSYPGHYQFVNITPQELPVLEWFQLFNFAKLSNLRGRARTTSTLTRELWLCSLTLESQYLVSRWADS